MCSMRELPAYFRARRALFLLAALIIGTTLVVPWAAGAGLLSARYAAGLQGFFFLCFVLADGRRYIARLRALGEVRSLLESSLQLPEGGDALEDAWRALSEDALLRARALEEKARRARDESLDYYTLWVHQIKTPISAMRLVLERQEGREALLLREELFKIERYADLALRYARLDGIADNLVPAVLDLDPLVRAAVGKYSLLFVLKKLTLKLEPTRLTVVSDAQWLSFILEQLLSNAVKYTERGGVKIYARDGRLVIEDSGRGIAPEDLPRVFEKGFTGSGGRADGRASGIGLYLSRRAAGALGAKIALESAPGLGTRAVLSFPPRDLPVDR